MKSFLSIALVAAVAASPCPYGQMAERGELSAEDAAKFFKARSEGETFVKRDMVDVAKREEHAAQEQFYKRQILGGLLPLGKSM